MARCELCIPMTQGEQMYPVRYRSLSLPDAGNGWLLSRLDPLLAQLARRVYTQISFELGILRWEATAT
jgi:hypothetical protein